ncbi:AmmeMemoRadiSam system protein A [Candidatus Woesearchaeota archaeon]|nr:AmmeMemoRadiSam system protein A [Candidatus Woesearchaeota archaeon]
MLSPADGKKLIALARNSIESRFSGNKVDFSDVKGFDKKQGVFVTLHKHGRLRGCIGFPYPQFELYKAVADAAQAAAFEDPRFNPLEESELCEVDIEISVLSVPEEITGSAGDRAKNFIIGEDGLIIKSGLGSGLLLPQVFTEWKCDNRRALEMVCEKAGLDADAWKDEKNKLFKFQAQIFSED